MDFGLPLEWEYYDGKKLAELRAAIEPESKLSKLLTLVKLFNDWVHTPNGAERDRKENELWLSQLRVARLSLSI